MTRANNRPGNMATQLQRKQHNSLSGGQQQAVALATKTALFSLKGSHARQRWRRVKLFFLMEMTDRSKRKSRLIPRAANWMDQARWLFGSQETLLSSGIAAYAPGTPRLSHSGRCVDTPEDSLAYKAQGSTRSHYVLKAGAKTSPIPVIGNKQLANSWSRVSLAPWMFFVKYILPTSTARKRSPKFLPRNRHQDQQCIWNCTQRLFDSEQRGPHTFWQGLTGNSAHVCQR